MRKNTVFKIGYLVIIVFLLFLTSKELTLKAVDIPGTIASGPYYYYVDVENPISLDDLKDEISLIAYDEYDGFVTESITYYDEEDNYTLNVYDPYPVSRILGTYPVVFTAIDSSENTATLTVYLIVRDINKPYLKNSSVLEYEVDADDIELTDEKILKGLVAWDDYQQGENIKKTIISGKMETIVCDINIIHNVVVRLEDTSGNYQDFTVTVRVMDYWPPQIYLSKDTITVSYCANTTLEAILASITVGVEDNCDKTVEYVIKEDNFTAKKDKVGTYTVVLGATDVSKNTTERTLTIIVDDTIPPVFYLDVSKVFVSKDVVLTENDFLSLLSLNNQIKSEEYSAFVLEDEYTSSSEVEGSYKYRLRISYNEKNYEDFEFIVNVLDDVIKEEVKKTFFEMTIYVLKKIWYVIVAILKWPITQIAKALK